MSFAVSLVIVLAFIVPGAWVLGAAGLLSADLGRFLQTLLAEPSLTSASIALALAFGLGAIVDTTRTVLFDPILDILRKSLSMLRNGLVQLFCLHTLGVEKRTSPSGPPANYLSHIDDKSLPVFQMLIERTQEYYRFNANSCVALLVLAATRRTIAGPDYSTGADLILWVLAALFFLGSLKGRNATLYAMEQFCRPGPKGGE